jgi:hypothetical protein
MNADERGLGSAPKGYPPNFDTRFTKVNQQTEWEVRGSKIVQALCQVDFVDGSGVLQLDQHGVLDQGVRNIFANNRVVVLHGHAMLLRDCELTANAQPMIRSEIKLSWRSSTTISVHPRLSAAYSSFFSPGQLGASPGCSSSSAPSRRRTSPPPLAGLALRSGGRGSGGRAGAMRGSGWRGGAAVSGWMPYFSISR